MIKVEVKSNAVVVREGRSERTGRDYKMREQEAWAWLHSAGGGLHPYPSRIMITLEDNAVPYEPGMYALDPSSVYVGKFGSLMLGRISLKVIPGQSVKGA